MKKTAGIALGLALICLVSPGGAFAVEGKWTPDQILEHDAKWLRGEGLELDPQALWNPNGAGLLAAVAKIGGCSAGFVSADGLLVTNHHCAFSILQQHSTPANDLITDGFLATSRPDELSGNGVRATVPHRAVDVTAEVLAAIPAGADDLLRFGAIELKRKTMIAECERQPGTRCDVAVFDGGVRYVRMESLEFPDVRLVYAPPRSVGEYGGEVDNWSWPRHTGDFAFLRVYTGPDGKPAPFAAANVPYRPNPFLRVSARGAEPKDFVLVAGYPGLTYRSLTAPEMRERAQLYFPHRATLLRGWLDVMEAASAKDAAARIALADRVKSLQNQEKNARGQVQGLERGRILEKKVRDEREVLAWAAKRPEEKGAVAAYAELSRLADERLATWDRDFLLAQMRNGPKTLDLALTLVRAASERRKPDIERRPDYMDRNRSRLQEALRNDQKRFHPPTEEALLADLLGRFAALPAASRVDAVERLLGGDRGAAAIRAKAVEMHARSRVTDPDERLKMAEESSAQLAARHDPLLDLAQALDRDLLRNEEREDRFKGAISRLRPPFRLAVLHHAGQPVAPDGNGTLRVSLAHVLGYSPRDAVRMEPQTTVAGLAEKNTGTDPFAAPAALIAAAPGARKSRFRDPALGDVPVCFMADGDTTGGSSGSPILNAEGELVGVNFDRVFENVANDFGYNPDVARNVAVDIRYVLWVLETLQGEKAAPLFREMGLEAPRPAAR